MTFTPEIINILLSEDVKRHFKLDIIDTTTPYQVRVPLHDRHGRPITYVRGLATRKSIFLDSRTADDIISGEEASSLSDFIYHQEWIPRKTDHLFIVFGILETWWIWQCGFTRTVSIQDTSISNRQLNLINSAVTRHGFLWVLTDGDTDSISRGLRITEQLSVIRPARHIYQPKKKIIGLGSNIMQQLLTSH